MEQYNAIVFAVLVAATFATMSRSVHGFSVSNSLSQDDLADDASLDDQLLESTKRSSSLHQLIRGQKNAQNITPFVLLNMIRYVLYEHGMASNQVDGILAEIVTRLSYNRPTGLKRGWNRFNVQARFSPFGTKLVPNRNQNQNGGTLLRYGRSAL